MSESQHHGGTQQSSPPVATSSPQFGHGMMNGGAKRSAPDTGFGFQPQQQHQPYGNGAFAHLLPHAANRLALSHPLASQQRDRISPRSSTTMVALLPTRDQGTTAEVKARVTRLPSEPNDDVAILPPRYTPCLSYTAPHLSPSSSFMYMSFPSSWLRAQ
jgi:hypothetical protein